MDSNLAWIQRWRLSKEKERPGDRPVISIESLSTTGWVVSADLRDFGWNAGHDHKPVRREHSDETWLSSQAEGPILKVYCGPLMIEDALGVVKDFIVERENANV